MAGQAIMYKEGAAPPHWSTPACLLCGQAWADILEVHDQPLYSGKGVASPDTAEPRLQVRPSVVGNIPPFMEWSRHYARALQISSEVTLILDASGSWGCGVFTSAGEWFQLQWPGSWADVHITVKELLLIVMGTAMCGAQWLGRSVKCRCDNAEVVAIIRSGSSREERAMDLMRCRWSKIQLNPAGKTFTREM